MMRILLVLVLVGAAPALAQTPPAPSPYAGEETRAIKALSDTERRDLTEGRGMGLAKAAELNGYPGPAHVLELAQALSLDPDQLAATRELHGRMLSEAQRLGAALLEAENHLDRMFAHRHIDDAGLRRQVAAIAALQGELRAVHLAAHLEQRRLLTPEQSARYVALRGYTGSQPGSHRHGH